MSVCSVAARGTHGARKPSVPSASGLNRASRCIQLAGSSSDSQNACGGGSAGQVLAAPVKLPSMKQEPDTRYAPAYNGKFWRTVRHAPHNVLLDRAVSSQTDLSIEGARRTASAPLWRNSPQRSQTRGVRSDQERSGGQGDRGSEPTPARRARLRSIPAVWVPRVAVVRRGPRYQRKPAARCVRARQCHAVASAAQDPPPR